MGVSERRERERDQRRDLILNAAREIIAEEGLDRLSIRKIAGRIEFSPSVIYHYFKGKEDILNQIIKESYHKILAAVASSQDLTGNPVQRIKDMTKSYIHLALQMPDEYKAVMLGGSVGILEHTAMLFEGASSKRPALAMLCRCLKEVYKDKEVQWIERSAQVIWCATFGVIIRLMIEKDISADQREALIEHHTEYLVGSMMVDTGNTDG